MIKNVFGIYIYAYYHLLIVKFYYFFLNIKNVNLGKENVEDRK